MNLILEKKHRAKAGNTVQLVNGQADTLHIKCNFIEAAKTNILCMMQDKCKI